MANLKKNLGYQTIYQVLATCLPLITAPYLARVLGATQLGVFSYTQSISVYFTLFSMLGFTDYGTRSIAVVANDIKEVSARFWNIYTLQFLSTSIMLCMYVCYICFFCRQNYNIALIQGLYVISCYLDVNWLFFGLEKFKLTVTRNMIVKTITVILILVFVKSENDLWVYTLIMAASTIFSQLVLWGYVYKYIQFSKISLNLMKTHIKPILTLFIPLLAMSVYRTMDKTMLGLFTGTVSKYAESGFYYNADKVINIPACILGGFGTVLMPRISSLIGEDRITEADDLFLQSTEVTVFVTSAMTFGIAAVAKDFTPLFFGEGYEKCILLIIVLSPVLLIKAFSFSVRYQYLIPRHLDKTYIKSILCGVIVNLVGNVILIPRFGALGAVIGTLLAELVACVIQYIVISKSINCKILYKHCGIYILMGIIMFFVVLFISSMLNGGAGTLVLEVLLGAIVFICLGLVVLPRIYKRSIISIINEKFLKKGDQL